MINIGDFKIGAYLYLRIGESSKVHLGEVGVRYATTACGQFKLLERCTHIPSRLETPRADYCKSCFKSEEWDAGEYDWKGKEI